MNVAHSPLTPVFTGLRWGLHALFASLVLLGVLRAVFTGGPVVLVTLLGAAFLGTYAAGGVVAGSRRGPGSLVWLAALTALWLALSAVQTEGVYLVFPLFFLVLHLLPGWPGPLAVVVLAALAVLTIASRAGWSVGGVVGPVIGACVALLIGLGYRALAIESLERERLLAELVETRDRLVATERESAVLEERSRLARDIHDTVAQSLSSIQLLLHAAERADGARPGLDHIRLARETAAASLVETRGLIRELAPPDLRGEHGLAGALERLAASSWRPAGPAVEVRVPDIDLPMPLATALLRIAQGTMSNVVRHADASRAIIELVSQSDRLVFTVTDDGRGFDPRTAASPAPGVDSFGLRAIRERVDGLGGTVTVASAPGEGTRVRVELAGVDASGEHTGPAGSGADTSAERAGVDRAGTTGTGADATVEAGRTRDGATGVGR